MQIGRVRQASSTSETLVVCTVPGMSEEPNFAIVRVSLATAEDTSTPGVSFSKGFTDASTNVSISMSEDHTADPTVTNYYSSGTYVAVMLDPADGSIMAQLSVNSFSVGSIEMEWDTAPAGDWIIDVELFCTTAVVVSKFQVPEDASDTATIEDLGAEPSVAFFLLNGLDFDDNPGTFARMSFGIAINDSTPPTQGAFGYNSNNGTAKPALGAYGTDAGVAVATFGATAQAIYDITEFTSGGFTIRNTNAANRFEFIGYAALQFDGDPTQYLAWVDQPATGSGTPYATGVNSNFAMAVGTRLTAIPGGSSTTDTPWSIGSASNLTQGCLAHHSEDDSAAANCAHKMSTALLHTPANGGFGVDDLTASVTARTSTTLTVVATETAASAVKLLLYAVDSSPLSTGSEVTLEGSLSATFGGSAVLAVNRALSATTSATIGGSADIFELREYQASMTLASGGSAAASIARHMLAATTISSGGSAALSRIAIFAASLSVASDGDGAIEVLGDPLFDWYDTAWSDRCTVTFATAAAVQGSSKSAFKCYLRFTSGRVASKARADGTDILFTLLDGVTKIPHIMKSYDPATGAVEAWVLSDLSDSVDLALKCYFGNTSASDQQDPGGVAVGTRLWCHFRSHATRAFLANSASGLSGAWAIPTVVLPGVGATGPAEALGLGRTTGGALFSGDGEYFAFAAENLEPDESVTVMALVRFDSHAVADARLFSKATGTSEQDHAVMLSALSGGLRSRLKTGTNDGVGTVVHAINSGDYALTPGVARLVGMSYDGANTTLYADDTTTVGPAVTGNVRNNAWNVAVGNQPGGGKPFDGLIEELIVANTTWTPDDVATLHNMTLGVSSVLANFETQIADFEAVMTVMSGGSAAIDTGSPVVTLAATMAAVSSGSAAITIPGQVSGTIPCSHPALAITDLPAIAQPLRSTSAATGQYSTSECACLWNVVRRQPFYEPATLKVGILSASVGRQARDWTGPTSWVAQTHPHGIEKIKIGWNVTSESEMTTIDSPQYAINEQTGHWEFVVSLDLSTVADGLAGAKLYRLTCISFPAKGFPRVVHVEVFIDRDGALTPTVANGKIRYLSNAVTEDMNPAGNDTTGTGAITAPFATLRKAIDTAAASAGNTSDHVTIRVRSTGVAYSEQPYSSGTFKQNSSGYLTIETAPEDDALPGARFSLLRDLYARNQWLRRLETGGMLSGWSSSQINSGAGEAWVVFEQTNTHRASRRPSAPGVSEGLTSGGRWNGVTAICKLGTGPANPGWSESYRSWFHDCHFGLYDLVFGRGILFQNIGSDCIKESENPLFLIDWKVLNCWSDYSNNGYFPPTADPAWPETGLGHGDVLQKIGGTWVNSIILGGVALDPEHPIKSNQYAWPLPAGTATRMRYEDGSPSAARAWWICNYLGDGNDSTFRSELGDDGTTATDSILMDGVTLVDLAWDIQGASVNNIAVVNSCVPNTTPTGWQAGSGGVENCHMQTPIGAGATGGGANSTLFASVPDSFPVGAGINLYNRDFSPKPGGPLEGPQRPIQTIHSYPVDCYWREWGSDQSIGAVRTPVSEDWEAVTSVASGGSAAFATSISLSATLSVSAGGAAAITVSDPAGVVGLEAVTTLSAGGSAALSAVLEFQAIMTVQVGGMANLASPVTGRIRPRVIGYASVQSPSPWSDTSTPSAVGDASNRFYAYRAKGHINTVPNATYQDNETGLLRIIVCCAHNAVATGHARQRPGDMGIYRVLAALNGGLGSTDNDLAGWFEFRDIKLGADGVQGVEIVIDTNFCPTGWYELRVIAEPVHGVPFVMETRWIRIERTTLQGIRPVRYVSPTGAGSQNGLTVQDAFPTITAAIEDSSWDPSIGRIECTAGFLTVGNYTTRIENDAFIRICPIPGVGVDECVIRTFATTNTRRLRFERLTLDASVGGGVLRARIASVPNPSGTSGWGQVSGTPIDEYWLHDCKVKGDGGALVGNQYRYWIHEDGCAALHITSSNNPIPDLIDGTSIGTYSQLRDLRFALATAKTISGVLLFGVTEDGARFEDVSNHLLCNVAMDAATVPGHSDVLQYILRNDSAVDIFAMNWYAKRVGGGVGGPGIQGLFADASASNSTDRRINNSAFINFVLDQDVSPFGGKTWGIKVGGRNNLLWHCHGHNMQFQWWPHRIDEKGLEAPYPGHYGVSFRNSSFNRFVWHHKSGVSATIDPDGTPAGTLVAGTGPRPEWDTDPAVNDWNHCFVYDREDSTRYDEPATLGVAAFYPTTTITYKGTAVATVLEDFSDIVANPLTGDMRPAVGGWMDGLARAGITTPLGGVQSDATLAVDLIVPFDVRGNRYNPDSPSLGGLELNTVEVRELAATTTVIVTGSAQIRVARTIAATIGVEAGGSADFVTTDDVTLQAVMSVASGGSANLVASVSLSAIVGATSGGSAQAAIERPIAVSLAASSGGSAEIFSAGLVTLAASMTTLAGGSAVVAIDRVLSSSVLSATLGGSAAVTLAAALAATMTVAVGGSARFVTAISLSATMMAVSGGSAQLLKEDRFVQGLPNDLTWPQPDDQRGSVWLVD